jgi:hypothetical protein
MSSLEIYREFLLRGFRFQVTENRLDVKGTIEPLTPDLIGLLKAHKSEIMVLVAEWQKGGPFLQPNGNLVIPFNADNKYHWWNGGKSLTEIRREFSDGPYGPWHYTLTKGSLKN